MAIPKDSRDPLEKLKELQLWLVNNRVRVERPASGYVDASSETLLQSNPQAESEVADFKDWIKEIQSQPKPLFEALF